MSKRWYVPVLSVCLSVLLASTLVYGALFEEERTLYATANGSVGELEHQLDQLVFPRDRVIDVKITLAEDDFQDMLDDAMAEEMKPASVEYNGIKIDHIGFRTKGNLSLMSVVRSDSDRYSFKLSFDEYISSQRLYGISKINLNNSYSDPTYMREVLAYEMAEQLGLPVPKYSYVNLYINGELWGFYLAVEQIGDFYLERHFGDANGSLYKAIQGSGTELGWLGDNRDSYSGLVQKSDHADDDALIHMIDVLNNETEYEEVLDVSNVLRYIALNVVIANWDSYLGQTKHNYYLYEHSGVFSILPWDYNMAFGGGDERGGVDGERSDGADFREGNIGGRGSIGDGGIGGRGVGGGGIGGGNMSVASPSGYLDRPLISRLLAVDVYREQYYDYVREALQEYLTTDTFNSRVDEWAELIRTYVQQDPRSFYTYDHFESGIVSLKHTNASHVERLSQELDGGSQSNPSASNDISAPPVRDAQQDGQRLPVEDPFQGGGRGRMPWQQGEIGDMVQNPQTPWGVDEGRTRGIPNPGGMPGNFPGGMAGGMPGPGAPVADDEQDRIFELYATVILLVLMGSAAVFILTYKRKRL